MNSTDLTRPILSANTFVVSCRYFKKSLSASVILSVITARSSVIAGFNSIHENQHGYGLKSYAGFEAMAPELRLFLTPLIVSIFKGLRTHPAIFPSDLPHPSM
jgi:hypothetical protein